MTPPRATDFSPLEKIASAVLYEGFLLYPYRQSSVKNQRRWHFGTLGPRGGADRISMQTECLIEAGEGGRGGNATRVDVKIRFLYSETERELEFLNLAVGQPPERHKFSFEDLECHVEIESEMGGSDIWRFTVRILNTSEDPRGDCAMASVHTMFGVREGAFVSLMDPPEKYREAAASCRNLGTWPVLAGREGDRHLLLSSPIILYDYPRIAPESAGDFNDATEIDEMLTLRVLTLSDEEKSEVRTAGDRGRAILERTEALPQAAFAKMHGAIRGLRAASQLGCREGDRVRLHPKRKADIFDIALEGKVAVVEAVERDFEDNIHLAVTVEDDPGRDLGVARQIGHRFFFRPEEVELV